MNKIYLFLLALFAAVGFNANAAKPTKLNLFDWNQTIQLTPEGNGVFTGEYTVGNADQFRFVDPDNNYEYGAEGNDGDRTPTTNNTLNFKKTGSTFLIRNLSQGTKLYFKVTFASDTEGTVKFQSTPFSGGGGDTTDVLWQYSTSASGTKNTIIEDNGNYSFTAAVADNSDLYLWLNGTKYMYDASGYDGGAYWVDDSKSSTKLRSIDGYLHFEKYGSAGVAAGTYKFDISKSGSDWYLTVTKNGNVTPPTPTGAGMYLWSNVNGDNATWGDPVAMTLEGDWYVATVTATATTTNANGAYFTFSDSTEGVKAFFDNVASFAAHRICVSGTSDVAVTVNGASVDATKNVAQSSAKAFKFKTTAGWTYKIMISKSSPYTVMVTTENVEEDLDLDNTDTTKYWYLSGDINTWSSIIENNKRVPGNYFYGEDAYSDSDTEAKTGTDPQNNGYQVPTWRSGADTFNYRPEAGEDYKKFLSTREMNQMFRFRRVTQADVDALERDYPGYTKVDGDKVSKNEATEGLDGWWVLDLSKATDINGNPARLCGQFKIIAGSLTMNSDNYAFNGTNNLTEALEVGKMSGNIAKDREPNMTIKNTVIEGAKIFFRPNVKTDKNGTYGHIMVTGEEKTLYLYYLDLGSDNATVGCPTAGKIGNEYKYYHEGKQLNYSCQTTVNQSQWESTTMAVAKDDLPESLASLAEGYDNFKVWRLPIHPSLIHRSPMPFTAAIKSAKTGVEFAPVALHCDNEWFVEGDPVNLYLRYEDESMTPLAMYCNTYYNRYENGEMVGVRYQHQQYEKMADRQKYDKIPAAYQGYEWFKSGDVTTYFANGGYALFASPRGEMYPLGGINAVGTERDRVALNGVDLFYVIPSAKQLNILYNHLNGTFNESDKTAHTPYNTIQINAELFHEDHDLFGNQVDFSMDGSVTYRFRVYHYDEMSGELDKIADSDVTDKPFYDWDVTECGVGYYQVLVIATRGGKTYQAYDVYSIAE